MKGMKRMASILLAGLMCITSFDITVFADEAEYIEVTEDNIDEIVCNTVTSWAKLVEPSKELEVVDIKEVYNAATGEMEYTASLFDNVTPYGYVVLGVYDNEMVVLEGNVNKGQEGLYTETVEEIVESEGRPRRKIDIEETITKIGPMNYGLGYKDKKGKRAFKDRNGQDVAVEADINMIRGSYEEAQSIFIKKASWKETKYREVENSRIELSKYKKRPGLLTQDNTTDYTNQYACGIQALAQIAYMHGMITYEANDYAAAYKLLWDLCKTKIYNAPDIPRLGENDMENLTVGFYKYAMKKGYTKVSYPSIVKNPTTTWIKSCLKNNSPILMTYSIYLEDGEQSAHAISILGYVRATKVSSGNTWNYLMVYDGWNSSPSYLNYTCAELYFCEASKLVAEK